MLDNIFAILDKKCVCSDHKFTRAKKIPEQRSACSVHFPCLDLLWEVSEKLVFVAVVELVEEVVIFGVGEVMGVPRATHTYLVQQCLAHA